MARGVARSLVTALLVVGVAAAAGAGSAGGATRVPLTKWARAVCGDVTRWQQALLVRQARGTPPTDPATTKAALSDFYRGAARDTGSLLGALAGVGTPNVAHADGITTAVRHAFTAARDGFAHAAATAASLPTSDTTAFTDAVGGLQQELRQLGTTVSQALPGSGSATSAPELDRAFVHEPACRSFNGAAEPPCDAAHLVLAAALHDPSVRNVRSFRCSGKWAGAQVAAYGSHSPVLFHLENRRWQAVDPAQACADPTIPAALQRYCTNS